MANTPVRPRTGQARPTTRPLSLSTVCLLKSSALSVYCLPPIPSQIRIRKSSASNLSSVLFSSFACVNSKIDFFWKKSFRESSPSIWVTKPSRPASRSPFSVPSPKATYPSIFDGLFTERSCHRRWESQLYVWILASRFCQLTQSQPDTLATTHAQHRILPAVSTTRPRSSFRVHCSSSLFTIDLSQRRSFAPPLFTPLWILFLLHACATSRSALYWKMIMCRLCSRSSRSAIDGVQLRWGFAHIRPTDHRPMHDRRRRSTGHSSLDFSWQRALVSDGNQHVPAKPSRLATFYRLGRCRPCRRLHLHGQQCSGASQLYSIALC